ncbi:Pirin [Varanus komodoensis]|nr:Pirin [Varanus komodoensis]
MGGQRLLPPPILAKICISSAQESMAAERKVVKTVLSKEQAQGVGARVRRSIGRPETTALLLQLSQTGSVVVNNDLGPFSPPVNSVMYKWFDEQLTVTDQHGKLSVSLEQFLHVPAGGIAQQQLGHLYPVLSPSTQDGLQVLSTAQMTAGRGILHAEMPCSQEPAHGLQLWVNLRSSEKMVEPQYQELKSAEIPKPSQNGVTVSVISGESLAVKKKFAKYVFELYHCAEEVLRVWVQGVDWYTDAVSIWISSSTKEQNMCSQFPKVGRLEQLKS